MNYLSKLFFLGLVICGWGINAPLRADYWDDKGWDGGDRTAEEYLGDMMDRW